MSVCIKDNIQNMNLVIGCTVGCSYCYARNNVKRYYIIDDFSKPELFSEEAATDGKEAPAEFPADRYERFGGLATGVAG